MIYTARSLRSPEDTESTEAENRKISRGCFPDSNPSVTSAVSVVKIRLMENALVDLRNALRERLAIIRDEENRHDKRAHLGRLQNISQKIERLEAALPRPLDPQLAHYLKRKSYDKSLAHLEARDD